MALKNRTELALDMSNLNTLKSSNLVAMVDIIDLDAIYTGSFNLITDLADSTLSLGSNSNFDDTNSVISIDTGSTNGVQIGASTTNKLGFFGATPIVRPAAAQQAATTINTGGIFSTTFNSLNIANPALTDLTTSTTTTDIINWVDNTNTGVTTVLADAAKLSDLNIIATTVNNNNHEFIRNINSIRSVLAEVQNNIQTLAEISDAFRTALVGLGVIKGAA